VPLGHVVRDGSRDRCYASGGHPSPSSPPSSSSTQRHSSESADDDAQCRHVTASDAAVARGASRLGSAAAVRLGTSRVGRAPAHDAAVVRRRPLVRRPVPTVDDGGPRRRQPDDVLSTAGRRRRNPPREPTAAAVRRGRGTRVASGAPAAGVRQRQRLGPAVARRGPLGKPRHRPAGDRQRQLPSKPVLLRDALPALERQRPMRRHQFGAVRVRLLRAARLGVRQGGRLQPVRRRMDAGQDSGGVQLRAGAEKRTSRTQTRQSARHRRIASEFAAEPCRRNCTAAAHPRNPGRSLKTLKYFFTQLGGTAQIL